MLNVEIAQRPVARWLRQLISNMVGEPILLILCVALIVLQWVRPRAWLSLPALIDWPTIMTLTGLLILTKALELSGFLIWFAHRVVHHIRSERALACGLVGLAAMLSMLLTNDVALFVVVPLVLSLHELTALPLKRLVIFIALAVNAGSILTPIGNPQNLFLWQTSDVSFGRFVWTLAPLCAMLMSILYALTLVSFKKRPLDLSADICSQAVNWRLVSATAILFVAFVLFADMHYAGFGLIAIVSVFLLWRPQAVLKIDWLLLLIFALMFIVLRSTAALPFVQQAIAALSLDTPLRVYMAAMVLSQGVSNVPATLILNEFTKDWRALAFGASIGGFGFAIGSLANLIAARLAKIRGIWPAFHVYSILFWMIGGVAGVWLMVG